MRIAFFTPRSINPLHPRLLHFREFFTDLGIQPDFINRTDYGARSSRINWLTLWFFDLHAIRQCKPLIKNYDIVFINDLRYLPLAKHARKLNKIVIYDTIDHNVYLRFYQLEQKFRLFRFIKKPITALFSRLEKKYAAYCHEILVNSDSLFHYFNQHATILLYTSPFEKLSGQNNPENKIVFLYLGAFTEEKGVAEIIDLQRKTNLPLFIFGDVGDTSILHRINNNPTIRYNPKISVMDLKTELGNLLKDYFLFGFSLIKAAHYSYAVQEANKDIDYLAMGIPLIGNQRIPTKEKIDAGCGLLIDDLELIQKINHVDTRRKLMENCLQYYQTNYAAIHFNQKLQTLLTPYLPKASEKPGSNNP
ncbi:MAG: hypothetical protein WAZ98_00160 [Cyclobacteriaceae bacterium]